MSISHAQHPMAAHHVAEADWLTARCAPSKEVAHSARLAEE